MRARVCVYVCVRAGRRFPSTLTGEPRLSESGSRQRVIKLQVKKSSGRKKNRRRAASSWLLNLTAPPRALPAQRRKANKLIPKKGRFSQSCTRSFFFKHPFGAPLPVPSERAVTEGGTGEPGRRTVKLRVFPGAGPIGCGMMD